MADWPLVSAGQLQAVSEGFTVANESGVLLTASGTINTKGAWAAISTSTPQEADGIFITLSRKSAAGMQLVDIGIGGAGAEQVLIPNLFMGTASNSSYPKNLYFPVNIPAGSRVSGRVQSATASTTIRCAVHLLQSSFLGMAPFQRVVDLGTATATSRGTSLTLPGAINTWSAWTQIVASTSDPLKFVVPVYSEPGAAASATSGIAFCVQIGRGAAASEVAFGPEFVFNNSSTACSINAYMGFPCEIPAGQRLAMRYAGTTVPTTSLDGAIYGVVG